jgi:hypothetical protein
MMMKTTAYITIKLPGSKEVVYFNKKNGKIYGRRNSELPNQKMWLKKIHTYASEMSDDYGQRWNDSLWDRTRKVLERNRRNGPQTKRFMKDGGKAKNQTFKKKYSRKTER